MAFKAGARAVVALRYANQEERLTWAKNRDAIHLFLPEKMCSILNCG